MKTKKQTRLIVILCIMTLWSMLAVAADWPHSRGNEMFSRVSPESLTFPLGEAWRYTSAQPPAPAYSDSVYDDRHHFNPRLKSFYFDGAVPTEPADYDYCFEPVVMDGRLYFGSSSEEAVFCLDAVSGKTLWTHFTNGPVRFAPVCSEGKVFVSSDDGYVYCLDGKTGALKWQTLIGPDDSRIIGNGRLISAWPVRGSLVLNNGLIYCAAGMFPEQGVYIAALDVETGKRIEGKQVPHAASGQSLVVDNDIWIPEHRIAPIAYNLSDCSPPSMDYMPVIRGIGGSRTWRLDGHAVFGPSESGMITIRIDDGTLEGAKVGHGGLVSDQLPPGIFSAISGRAAVANDKTVVFLRDDQIRAIGIDDFRSVMEAHAKEVLAAKSKMKKRGKNLGLKIYDAPIGMRACDKRLMEMLYEKTAWMQKLEGDEKYYTVIGTPDAFIFGGNSNVMALDAASGKKLWEAPTEGKVYGLALSDGKLMASTSEGVVHCFASDAAGPAQKQGGRKAITANASAKAKAFAEEAIKQVGRDKGFCLAALSDRDEVAAIATESDMTIILMEENPTKARELREYFRNMGLLGKKVFVRQEDKVLDALRFYPKSFANLTLVGADMNLKNSLPLVQPYGGICITAKGIAANLPGFEKVNAPDYYGAVYRRGIPEGYGQWASGTGDPGNSMCTGEDVVKDGPFQIQWFGRPYASESADRHYVPQTPLFKDGILYYPGRHHSLMAIDAYNGTILWDMEQPRSLRYMASHNPSAICCGDDKQVFAVSGDVCWQVDGITGEKVKVWKGALDGYDWGYVNNLDGMLIGSSQGKVVGSIAAHESVPESKGVQQVQTNFSSMPAVSKDLFAYDVKTGERIWTWTDGAIISNSICFGDGKVFFLQSDNNTAMNDKQGLVQLTEFLKEDTKGCAEFVALDMKTGKEVWKQKFTSPMEKDWLVYLTYANSAFLVTHTGYPPAGGKDFKTYRYERFNPDTGESIWETWVKCEKPGIRAGLSFAKNTLSARPIVVDDTFYLVATLPGNDGGKQATPYSLETGKQLAKPVQAGTNDKGCSTALASLHAFYYRDWHHVALPIKAEKNYHLTGVTRPSCWPNTLPVGGLILAPEGAAACSCGFQYQISFALAPRQ